MPKFLIEIPVRITPEGGAVQEHAVKFHVLAEDANDVLEFIGLLLMNELDDGETEDIEPVWS